MSHKIPCLIGDIGGTNARFTLILVTSKPEENPEEIETKYWETFQFPSVKSVFDNFLEKYQNTDKYPQFGVFGVASPVKNNTLLQFVNIPHWIPTNGDELAKELKMKKIVFMNDYAANGYGIQTKLIEGKDYLWVNKQEIDPNGTKLTFGAGTGLGFGYCVKDPHSPHYIVCDSQGGRQDYVSKNDLQYALMAYLAKYYGVDHVSVERASCGQSLIPIYQFLKDYEKIEPEPTLYAKLKDFHETSMSDNYSALNKELVQKGLKEECPLCKRTLELFVEIYGGVCGNFSTLMMPYGGIYILGGLSVALEPIIVKKGIFMKAYGDKGRIKPFLDQMPIMIITVHDIAIRGLREYCRRLVEEDEKK